MKRKLYAACLALAMAVQLVCPVQASSVAPGTDDAVLSEENSSGGEDIVDALEPESSAEPGEPDSDVSEMPDESVPDIKAAPEGDLPEQAPPVEGTVKEDATSFVPIEECYTPGVETCGSIDEFANIVVSMNEAVPANTEDTLLLDVDNSTVMSGDNTVADVVPAVIEEAVSLDDVSNAQETIANSEYDIQAVGDGYIEVASPYGSGRLLVDGTVWDEDTAGAVLCVSYGGMTILQYPDSATTGAAYEFLSGKGYDVEVDNEIMAESLPVLPEDLLEGENDALSWGHDFMGFGGSYPYKNTVVVAVVDSGIDLTGGFFDRSRILDGVCLTSDGTVQDGYGHGTHIAGIIYENTPSTVKIFPIKVLDDNGRGSLSILSLATQYAIEAGADIMNMSLAANNNTKAHTAIDNMFRKASESGTIPVCCAGNGGGNADASYPARCPYVIGVSSVGQNGAVSVFSNTGSAVDFCAPGDSIVSAGLGGTYATKSGTSQASAHLSAAFACLKSAGFVTGASTDAAVSELSAYATYDMLAGNDPSRYGNGCVWLDFDRYDISKGNVVFSPASYGYTGSAITPAFTVTDRDGNILKSGTHFVASLASNTAVGTASAVFTGTGVYYGDLKGSFSITGNLISKASFSGIKSSYAFTGAAIKPTVKVVYNKKTLVKGTDYTVTYKNNTSAGTASIVIKGKGSYTGSKTIKFTIAPVDISSLSGTLSSSSAVYTGSAFEPAPTVVWGSRTLVSGTDYTMAYSGNVNAGTGAVTLTGTGNFTGTMSLPITITKCAMSKASVSGISASYELTGSAIKPVPVVKYKGVTLKSGTDYSVAYSNNIDLGTATVTITGKKNFSGKVKKTFLITSDFTESVASGGTYFIIPKTDWALAVSVKSGSSAYNAQAQLVVKNNAEYERFVLTATADGSYMVEDSMSSLYLMPKAGASSNGTAAVYNRDTGAAWQKWDIARNTDGTFSFINAGNGKALYMKSTVSGGILGITDKGTGVEQRFYLLSTDPVSRPYQESARLVSAANTSMAVQSKSLSKSEGANIQLAKKSSSAGQVYDIIYCGSGYYRISNSASGKVLTVEGNSTASGTNVKQAEWTGAKGQKWKIVNSSGGRVIIRSALGTVLTVNTSAKAGANVQADKSASTTLQKWILLK